MKKCFIIAEAGVNHNGSMDMAERLVLSAKAAGADAVKFQTFCADRLAGKSAEKAHYQKQDGNACESQHAMLSRLSLNLEQHRELLQFGRHTGITFLSSPFDEGSADWLSTLDVPLFKIGSGEITNFPLLESVAKKGKPIILSTGMSRLGEVEAAVQTIQDAGCRELTLLHCTSSYPADPADSNLRAMRTLQRAFNLPVGYSDHTPGIEVSVAAVALGAAVIEKHLTLDKTLPGPDHRASLNPEEFKSMVDAIRTVEAALGDGVKRAVPSEFNTRDVARKSLVAAIDISEGTVLNETHIAIKRPGTGLPPGQMPMLMGRKVKRSIRADELFNWKDVG